MRKDAFDLWWEWAEKPVDSMLTIDAAYPRWRLWRYRLTNGAIAQRSIRPCARASNLAKRLFLADCGTNTVPLKLGTDSLPEDGIPSCA